ncbi:dipicolinate synthase subunit DpsA [Virgibacillus halophilus]|uniref:Dipicolinate synthase subunit DpsA n=1 Tax=Tigheibacillus halophilus TaxID=361280 RepID=A0ABU5C9N8_9BACI|nr:dipicolinate synthase subunit DpsA [Virgibacillus halophilus]
MLIGGDERYLEVVRKLDDLGASVVLAGYDKAGLSSGRVQISKLEDVNFSNLYAILLPVSGTDGEGNITMSSFTDQQLCLTEQMISQLPPSCKIYTGVSGSFLKRMGSKFQKRNHFYFGQGGYCHLQFYPDCGRSITACNGAD